MEVEVEVEVARHFSSPPLLSLQRTATMLNTGRKILDRRVMSMPDTLLVLEAQGEVVFLGRLLDRQNVELSSLVACAKHKYLLLPVLDISWRVIIITVSVT